jgi:hypothetical protein
VTDDPVRVSYLLKQEVPIILQGARLLPFLETLKTAPAIGEVIVFQENDLRLYLFV